jgi:hypothetical protein
MPPCYCAAPIRRGRTTDDAPCNDNAGFDCFADPAMRAMLTYGSLLIVLAVIALSVNQQLRASSRFLPSAAASGAASGPLAGTPANQVSQYQRELDQAMKAAARHTDEQAASAGEDGTR